MAITTVNVECSAVILNKVPEKLKDPGKFLIPQLGLGALKPTRMTLELANRSVTHPMGIAEDVVVRVDGFTFLADFSLGSDELVFYAEKSEKSKNKQFAHAISVIDFSKDEPFSGSTTIHSDALPPSSSPVKTSDNLEEFADELTLLDSFPLGNDDSVLKKDMVEDVVNENSNVSNSDEPVLLNTPLSDKVECSNQKSILLLF
ncbi:hypothetical protein Tco_1213567 [Tanacetum coccineum]